MDRTLDLVVHADRSLSFKDVDELAWAESVGEYSSDEADQIRKVGERAHDHFSGGGWPLDATWDDWRPRSQGRLPRLDPHWLKDPVTTTTPDTTTPDAI